jgi:hypothetical protein
MLLTPGTRIGPHEIVAELGEGGMGEVDRARDARLNGDVAPDGTSVLIGRVADPPMCRHDLRLWTGWGTTLRSVPRG